MKPAIKAGKSLMVSASPGILSIAIKKDVKLGKTENVLNAPKDGTSMLIISVLKSVISVILGIQKEIVKAAIKATLSLMVHVSEIQINLFPALIASVLNGMKEFV